MKGWKAIGVVLALLILIVLALFWVRTTQVRTYPRVSLKDSTLVQMHPVQRETRWTVRWYGLTGELKRAGFLGTETFPSTFFYDWGYGKVFKDYDDYLEFEADAEIYAPRSGLFFFRIGSDDGSKLLIDGKTVLTNQWIRGGTYTTRSRKVMLKKGKHHLKMKYWERTRRAAVLFDCSPDLLTWTDSIPETLHIQVPETTLVAETLRVPFYRALLKH